MTSPIKQFYLWMTNQQDKRVQLGIPLSPEDTDKFKALIQENNALKAQLGLRLAEEKRKYEEEKQVDKEQEIIYDLKEQEKEILKNRYGVPLSLYSFFKKMIEDKKFREGIDVTDKNDEEIFAKLGDIQVIQEGKYAGFLLVVDIHGNPLKIGRSIADIIYKPETLRNQLKRRRILLPVDKNFNHTPDIENMEMNDIEYDEDTDTYKESMEYKARVKDLIVKYLKELRDKSEYIERLELTQIEQARQINDLKRATLVLRNQSQTSQSELSNAMGLTMQFNSKIGEMNRKIASLTEIKALYEGIIERLETVNKKVLDKLEIYGGQTIYEQTKAEIQQDMEFYKNMLPETINQIMPHEEKITPVYPPGTSLGTTGKVK